MITSWKNLKKKNDLDTWSNLNQLFTVELALTIYPPPPPPYTQKWSKSIIYDT
jgi:hypothetical protein